LTITSEEMAHAMSILEACMKEVETSS